MPKVNTRDWESYDDDNYISYEKIRKTIENQEEFSQKILKKYKIKKNEKN